MSSNLTAPTIFLLIFQGFLGFGLKSYHNKTTISGKKSGFPIRVTEGSVTAKIYKIRNKFYVVRLKNGEAKQIPRFKVYYFAEGRRFQKSFADLDEAKAHAKQKVEAINKGNLKALPFGADEVHFLTTASPSLKV